MTRKEKIFTEFEKNLYELLVNQETAKGFDSETKEYIFSSPPSQQREMIASVLVENNPEHRFLFSKIEKILRNKTLTSTKYIKNVIKMLREYVEVSTIEKKKYGEVMTPLFLVNDMLDTLPNEVWSNPDLKWLDPANGVGIFMAVVIERLMDGLKGFESDDEKRYKHIVENMIYVGELQAKNLFLYMYAIDPEDKYAINIFNGDYLSDVFDEHMKYLGIDKFDVIVMNPPYNDDKGSKGSSILWDKFINKVFETSSIYGGYLVAVHPPQWRIVKGKQTKIKKLLQEKQVLFLEIHNMKDGVKTFGVQTAYDFYCVRNIQNNGYMTKIKFMDGETRMFDISKLDFIPNGMFEMFQKLIAKNNEEKVKILYSRSAYGNDKTNMSKEKNDEFIYPCVYSIKKGGVIDLWYSNINTKGHFNVSKVIWSKGGASTPIVDKNGEYGVMNFACSIVDDVQNLEGIQQAMSNPLFHKLMLNVDGIYQQRYKDNVIAIFRKDFWKEFI